MVELFEELLLDWLLFDGGWLFVFEEAGVEVGFNVAVGTTLRAANGVGVGVSLSEASSETPATSPSFDISTEVGVVSFEISCCFTKSLLIEAIAIKTKTATAETIGNRILLLYLSIPHLCLIQSIAL